MVEKKEEIFFTKEFMEKFFEHKGERYSNAGEIGFRHGYEKAKKLV